MAGRGIVAALFICLLPVCGLGGEAPAPLKVKAGVFLNAPFVTLEEGGGYAGMAMELWKEATRGLNFDVEYIRFEAWGDLLEAVGKGTVDVGIGAITVSHRRARYMHFSFPWYDGGMRILKKADRRSFWTELIKSQRVRVYGLFVVVFLVLAALMTWFRRRKDPEFPKDLKSGYTLSLLDITSSVRCGELNQEYLGWKGHILSAVWMMFGMAMVAYVTSTMTTAMTTVKLDADGIYELGDLPGKKVGGLRGGMSARYLRDLHLDFTGYRTLDDAVRGLLEGKVRAVVSDAPVLEHWAYSHPGDGVEVVGPLFHPDKYAFAANVGWARNMDLVTVELIRLVEGGEVERLRKKYLGDGHGYLFE